VIEGGRRLSLADKALHSIAMRGNFEWQNLQSNFAFEFCVMGQIDLTHPACSDFGDDAVM
jgi:hypothetical protein